MSISELKARIQTVLESHQVFTEGIVSHNEQLNGVRAALNSLLDGSSNEQPLEGAQIIEQIQAKLVEVAQLAVHLSDVLRDYQSRL